MSVLQNYINGRWVDSLSDATIGVENPATGKVISKVPAGTATDIDEAVKAASATAKQWRDTPAVQRVQYLYKMKSALEAHADEIAAICTDESGKTFGESKAELVRAIENIEVACGIPTLMQSEFSEDIARGIDEFMIRQPLGVCACIAPFNFPIMIPFWFMPYAIACGNTYIVKPSEKVPGTMTRIFEILAEAELPAGVLNLVHGAKDTVNAILDHPEIKAISFVGSTAIAKYVYQRGTANGKRVQAQGGAKNPVIIMPDADIDATVRIIADSVYGCSGQRCLAASLVVMVGEAKNIFRDKLIEAAQAKKTGYGMKPDVAMGPVITRESKERIESIIDAALQEGCSLLLDGRGLKPEGYEDGFFVGPTVLDDVRQGGNVFSTEIFGPVMGLMYADTLDDAIALVNSGHYGNSACIFTRSGSAARKFRHDAMAGNIGVNIGVAAPMAFFPFSGWKDSFFGDLHAQSHHAVEFYTQTKVVIERWHDEWNRKF
ncbi:MAG: CoA-acylating methylmalonate-semialdehyde dehydrogenase [Tannerella sp.]|jgi:malonate-semialdehyde dehydrogenase (acetylating)/methylmalonate-semialdehyde dehydrogenase|nr:CoA-acylating methylmalonate-semialdehyde dehydrogenase [Tannerella sp.]